MNKSELISSISEKSDITKAEAEKALNAFIESIEEALANGDKVQLIGFGTFEVRERPALLSKLETEQKEKAETLRQMRK